MLQILQIEFVCMPMSVCLEVNVRIEVTLSIRAERNNGALEYIDVSRNWTDGGRGSIIICPQWKRVQALNLSQPQYSSRSISVPEIYPVHISTPSAKQIRLLFFHSKLE